MYFTEVKCILQGCICRADLRIERGRMQLEALTSVMLNAKKSERVLGGKMFPENTDVGSYQIPYSAVILHLHVQLDACL